MAINDYHFVTQWRLQATAEEVNAVLGDALGLPRWWPAVYLDVQEIAPGDANGVGRVIDLHTKGWLPYTLRWRFRVREVEGLTRIVLLAEGDFIGRGIWTVTPDGDWVDITYDWKITARKPLLRSLSFLFKPIFAANHHWAMRQGEESLRLEIARWRAQSEEVRKAIPPPSGPTPTTAVAFLRYVVKKIDRKKKRFDIPMTPCYNLARCSFPSLSFDSFLLRVTQEQATTASSTS